MSQSTAEGHAHHWEVSWAPIATVFGILFVLPLTFSAYYVYGSSFLASIFAGIGVPLLLAGIVKWVHEGLTQTPLVEGLSPSALPYFIVSEVFIFLGFFTSYWALRLSAGADWPPEGTPEIDTVLPMIMTVLLVSSSVAFHIAEAKSEENDLAGFRLWLVITIILGGLFLGCTGYEYTHLLHAGFGPSTNLYGTFFYSITGFHASHVIVGLGLFIAVLLPALRGKTNKYFTFCVGVYWHFVDVVWFFVASQIYFW